MGVPRRGGVSTESEVGVKQESAGVACPDGLAHPEFSACDVGRVDSVDSALFRPCACRRSPGCEDSERPRSLRQGAAQPAHEAERESVGGAEPAHDRSASSVALVLRGRASFASRDRITTSPLRQQRIAWQCPTMLECRLALTASCPSGRLQPEKRDHLVDLTRQHGKPKMDAAAPAFRFDEQRGPFRDDDDVRDDRRLR